MKNRTSTTKLLKPENLAVLPLPPGLLFAGVQDVADDNVDAGASEQTAAWTTLKDISMKQMSGGCKEQIASRRQGLRDALNIAAGGSVEPTDVAHSLKSVLTPDEQAHLAGLLAPPTQMSDHIAVCWGIVGKPIIELLLQAATTRCFCCLECLPWQVVSVALRLC
jgi:hypothetical protein